MADPIPEDEDLTEYKDLTRGEILAEVTEDMGSTRRMQVDWEHDRWWLTDLDTGCQWAVHESPPGLSFEMVTFGLEG